MYMKMQVRFIIVILSVIGAIYILAWTADDIRNIDKRKKTEYGEWLTAGVSVIIKENHDIYQEPAKGKLEDEPMTVQAVYQEEVSQSEIRPEDKVILSKLAMAEAEGEDIKGKALVMKVVLNRVNDPRFPNSIEEVVFQDGQFSTVAENGRYWRMTPDKDCMKAIQLIESGWNDSRGALYFESFTRDSWQSRHCTFLFKHGGHKFYE